MTETTTHGSAPPVMALTREQIAARLRQYRESLGFTQTAVATELGVHRPTISEIEAGRRAVTAEELYRLAEIYGVSVAEILAVTPDEPTPVHVMAYRFPHDTEMGWIETYTYGSAQPPERLERTDGKPPFVLPPQVTRFDDSQRRTLDAFAAKLRQEWRHLPATDRRLDTAQRMTGIPADDLLDYLLGLKEPDLAHLILLSDYCGCHAVDLWPTNKEVKG